MNDNFYHVAQGSRLPMGGSTLEATTGVYDIGTTTARWANLYARNLYLDGSISSSNVWKLISHIQVTATTNRIDVSGLNGDNALSYMIYWFGVGDAATTTTQECLMALNNVSTASYGRQYVIGQGAVVGAARESSTTLRPGMYIPRQTSTGAAVGFCKTVLYAKSGIEKTLLHFTMLGSGSFIQFEFCTAEIMNNTNTLTSITFLEPVRGMFAGTEIFIYSQG